MEAKNERAQFEAWLPPSMPRDGQIDEDGDFFYRDDWVQGAWIAWRHFAQQAVPNGWQLVPIEATPEMETANAMYGDTSDWWNAVLTAAPKPEHWA